MSSARYLQITMEFFTGQYRCKLDSKGRIILPAKVKAIWPDSSVNKIILRQGREPCLLMYTLDVYREIMDEVRKKIKRFGQQHNSYRRHFFGGIAELDLDSNGRFLIPKTIGEHAKVSREVLLIGMGDWLEMWNPTLYKQYITDQPADIAELEDELFNDTPEYGREASLFQISPAGTAQREH